MVYQNIKLYLRNDSDNTINIGSLSIASGESSLIWDTLRFDSGIVDVFGQVVDNIGTFNENIGNGNLVLVLGDTSAITSDDFDSTTLDAKWTFTDTVGDCSLSMPGGTARISVPGGVNHDLWTPPNNVAPRIIQSHDNSDFIVEARFTSLPAQVYELQGIVSQESVSKFVRTGIYYDGSLRAFAATIDNAANSIYANIAISASESISVKVVRTGTRWLFYYAVDDGAYVEGADFTFSQTVNDIGIYAGNSDTSTGFVGIADYFVGSALSDLSVQEAFDQFQEVLNIYNTLESAEQDFVSLRFGQTRARGLIINHEDLVNNDLKNVHPQYAATDGSNAFIGDLDLGGNDITNVGNVDGVDVSAHASRHNPGGTDALSTAVPVAVTVGASNAEGSASSFARSDHTHEAQAADPVNVTKAANAAGIATTFARSDHKHDVTTAAPTTIGTANSEGSATSLARSDHVHSHGAQTDASHHAVATTSLNGFMSSGDKTKLDGLPTSAVPTTRTLTAGAGLTGGGDLSADRTFNVGAADASIVVNADSIGVGVLQSDAMHGTRGGGTQHSAATTSVAGFMSSGDKTKLDGIATGATNTPLSDTVPANVTKSAASAGVATEAARQDHKHDITTAAGGAILVGATGAEGSSTSLARADHTHTVTAGTPVNVTKATAAEGTATTFARSDHKHDITTAAASTLSGSNAEGSSTSLARADHNHALGGTVGGDLSGTLPNPTVTDLTITSEQQGSVLYFDGSNWVQLTPGTSGQVLQTQGAAADPLWATVSSSDSGAPPKYFDAFDTTGGTNVTAGAAIPLDTQRVYDADYYTHSTVTNNSEVTIDVAGVYMVLFRCGTRIPTGTSRSASEAWLELDTGSGFVEIPGTRGVMYNREVNEGGTHMASQAILSLSAGDKLRGFASRISGTDTIHLEDDNSGIVIVKLPEAGNLIGVRKNSTGTVFERGQLNLIEGTGVTLTVADDGVNGEVDITIAASGGSGDVVGPASATDNGIARYDGTTGKLIQNSSVTIDDNGNVYLNVDGSTQANPRIFGAVNFSDTEAIRWEFGDGANGIQNSWGGAMSAFAYHTIILRGDRNLGTAPSFETTSNIGVWIPNTTPASPALVVDGAASQTGALQQWRSSTPTVLLSVDASGNIVMAGSQTVDGRDVSVDGSTLDTHVGSTSNPHSTTLANLTDTDLTGIAQGNILYRNATQWVVLPPGTSGQYLQTQGASANPQWATVSGTGDVVGPASATDNALVRYDGTTGKLIQNSGWTLLDTNQMEAGGNLDLNNNDISGVNSLQIEGENLNAITVNDGGTVRRMTGFRGSDQTLFIGADDALVGTDKHKYEAITQMLWEISNSAKITVTSSSTTFGNPLDMGGNNITNVGTVDGRDVSADGSNLDSHLGSTSNPHFTSLANLVDTNIATPAWGELLYRGSSLWQQLAVGTSGQVLSTQGTNSAPQWVDRTLANLTDTDLTGIAQGSILYRNATQWVVLTPGTSGQVLQTQGAGANPQWATGGGSGGYDLTAPLAMLSQTAIDVDQNDAVWFTVFAASKTFTATQMCCYVTQATTGTVYMALYDASLNLLAEATTGASTATKGIATVTLDSSYAVEEGTLYYMAIRAAANGSRFGGHSCSASDLSPGPVISGIDNNAGASAFPATLNIDNRNTSAVWMALKSS